MTGITVYTTSACPKHTAIECTEADMTTPAAATELRANGVFTMMTPVLRVGDSCMTLEEMSRTAGA